MSSAAHVTATDSATSLLAFLENSVASRDARRERSASDSPGMFMLAIPWRLPALPPPRRCLKASRPISNGAPTGSAPRGAWDQWPQVLRLHG